MTLVVGVESAIGQHPIEPIEKLTRLTYSDAARNYRIELLRPLAHPIQRAHMLSIVLLSDVLGLHAEAGGKHLAQHYNIGGRVDG